MQKHAERMLAQHAAHVFAPFGALIDGSQVHWPRERSDEWRAILRREMPGLVADLIDVDLDDVRERWRTQEEKAFILARPPRPEGQIATWEAGARDHQQMREITMPTNSRSPQEWRALADGTLHRAGWRRIEEWWSPLPGAVAAHIEPATATHASCAKGRSTVD